MNDVPDPADSPTPSDDPQGELRERRRSSRRRRRGGDGDVITIIRWRDIPAQLTVRTADGQHKLLLHARFQHAIDRAAGVAGLTSTDDYVREWRSETVGYEGDPEAALDQLNARFDDEYPRARLESLVQAGGLDPDTHPTHDEQDPT